MDADAEKLLMAFMEGSLDEQGASRLLERLDSDPEFREMAVRHWRMDRLLEAGVGEAEESIDAIRRSVRIRMEGSPAESVELSRRVGSSLRSRKGSGVYRRVPGRGRSSTASPWMWALGGALAAALLIGIAISFQGGTAPVRPPKTAAKTPDAPVVAVPAPEKKEPRVIRNAEPSPVPPPGPSVPVPSTERRPAPPAPKQDGTPRSTPVPAPRPKSEPRRRTVPTAPVQVATLVEVEGTVIVKAGGDSRPGRRGEPVHVGSGLEIGPDGRAVVVYPDGTRVTAASSSIVDEFGNGPSGGKSVLLSRGSLRAAVQPQPQGKPMVLTTPQADAQVLGTEFTLTVKDGATRLEVSEGRVRLTRRRDRSSVEVPAGHFALAHPTRRLSVRALETPTVDPLVVELEAFGTGRSVKPANGERGRLFLEPIAGASKGTCVSAPGTGTTVAGELALAGGTSTLWVRWRDDLFDRKKETVSFEVLANGRVVKEIRGGGADKTWKWTSVQFQGKGKMRLSLRSTYAGEIQTAAGQDTKKSPYAAVVRWDQIILTRDATFVPGSK